MSENVFGWDYAPKDNAENYIKKCRLFSSDDVAFNNFRRDADYTRILEGNACEIGNILMSRIFPEYNDDLSFIKDNLVKFKENDIYGSPFICNYEFFGDICPCTLIYIYNTLEIKRLVGNSNIKKIVEIGGGFGALCKTLSVLYNFEEYILIDLPDVISLCKKYLDHFPDIKSKITYITTKEFENVDEIKDVDLFIASASLAECNREIQSKYINKILKNSKFGYIIYNTLHIPTARSDFNYIMENLSSLFDITNVRFSDIMTMFIRCKDQNK